MSGLDKQEQRTATPFDTWLTEFEIELGKFNENKEKEDQEVEEKEKAH